MKDGKNSIYVVTPSFNAVGTIERTILSVVTQAGNFRVRFHVQDGGSTDGTVEVIERWKNRLVDGAFPIQCNGVDFSFQSERDDGMYDALVRAFGALSIAHDAFMTWINADDLLMPGALALVDEVGASFSDQEVSWLGGASSIMKNDMTIVQAVRPISSSAIKKGLCDGRHWDFVQQEGTFFRKWLWEAVDASVTLKQCRLAGDWNLWRLFAHHAELVQASWPLGVFRVREGQLSQVSAPAYMAEIDKTISPQCRLDALKLLGDFGGVNRRILKALYPSGKLLVIEKSANVQADSYYKKHFGRLPARPANGEACLAERVVFEGNTGQKHIESVMSGVRSETLLCSPDDFNNCTYARRSHWRFFDGLDVELFGEKKNLDSEQLKIYQDLFVLRFIRENIPPGTRILDVGGGISRILAHLAGTYECWNIDKLEGMGNGPRALIDPPYRLVRDYMGNFNQNLPDNYFDFVFSISALEHVPEDSTTLFANIVRDIDRVLKSGGLSLHLFDIVVKENWFWTNKFTKYIFDDVDTLNKCTTFAEIHEDPDFYAMSEAAYNKSWLSSTKKSYEQHGRPSSLNILWRKRLSDAEGADRQEKSKAAPLVSGLRRVFVVTPCLNVAATIDETIESVVAQAGRFAVRYHVQDGGSNDGTIERLRYWFAVIKESRAYENIQFSWASAPDGGMYDALRRGFDSLEMLPDDFMTWINGDDILLPGAFCSVAQIASLNPEIQWIGGTVRVIDQSGQVLEERDGLVPQEVIREGLCDGRHWHHLQQEGMFFKKRLWFRGKHALAGFNFAGDWSLWHEFSRHSEYFQIDQALGAFRSRATQLSVANRKEYDAEIAVALSEGQRAAAFKRLYALRSSLRCKVLRLSSDQSEARAVERDATAYFEYFFKREGCGR